MTSNADELLIRADASPSVGGGHVSRCLALAEAWLAQGGRARLLAAENTDALLRRARAMGVEMEAVPHLKGSMADADHTAARCGGAAVLVMDGYHFDTRYQSRQRDSGLITLVLDDVAGQRGFDCDLVLNVNAHAQETDYANRLAPGTRLLLGPRHALLQRNYTVLASRRRDRSDGTHLLISLGGGGHHGSEPAAA